MPEVSIVSYAIWATTFICYATLTLILIRHRVARRWPSLFLYTTVTTIVSPILFMLYRGEHAAAYFWTFWIERYVLSGLRFAIIWQIAQTLLAVNSNLRKIVIRSMLVATCIAITVSLGATLSVPAPYYLTISRIATSCDRWLAFASCILFVIMAFSLDLLGIRWKRQILFIGVGLALQGAVFTCFAWALAIKNLTPAELQWASIIRDLADLAVIFIWIYSFSGTPESRDLPPFSAQRLTELSASVKTRAEALQV